MDFLTIISNIPKNHTLNIYDNSYSDKSSLLASFSRWMYSESFEKTLKYIKENLILNSDYLDELEECCSKGLKNLLETYESNNYNVKELEEYIETIRKFITVEKEKKNPPEIVSLSPMKIIPNNNEPTNYSLRKTSSDLMLNLLLQIP